MEGVVNQQASAVAKPVASLKSAIHRKTALADVKGLAFEMAETRRGKGRRGSNGCNTTTTISSHVRTKTEAAERTRYNDDDAV